MAAFDGATAWLNSEPLTSPRLHGKVVLVDFWTYSCINWRRQLPYVRAWAERYVEHGLVVIGVHSPEFSFEKNVDNVRWAAKDMRIDYPIVIDNDHAIWRAFNNEYWPALYFADAKGRIRHSVFGEGQYEQSEVMIQRLLSEASVTGIRHELISAAARGAEAAADWNNLKSGENYLGYGRTENFSSSGGARADKRHEYSAPKQLGLNGWALSGVWTMGKEAIALNQANGRILYRFHARDLHLVMGPARPNTPIAFRVSIDGQAPQNAHGVDVDEQGNGTVTESRMYQLIRQPSSVVDRLFEIQFLDAGRRRIFVHLRMISVRDYGMNDSESFSNSTFEEQMHLAERELSSFVAAVTKLFGPDEARVAADDWLDESDLMDSPPRSEDRDWHSVTIAASARLANRVDAARHRQQSATA